MANPVPTPLRRTRRRWLIRFGLLLLLLGLLVWFAPVIVAKTGLRQIVLDRAFADLNGRVTAGDASLGWLSPIELREIQVSDAKGQTVLTADRITTSRTLLELARDQSELGMIVVEHPVAEVICEPGSTNLESLLQKYLTSEEGAAPAERIGVAVEVEQGRLVLKEEGRPGEQLLDPVNATVTIPRTFSEPITIVAQVGAPDVPGSISTKISIHEETAVELKSHGFEVEAIGPLISRFSKGTTVAGRLTADMTARWRLDAVGGNRLAVKATMLSVEGLELTSDMLGRDRVRMTRIDCPASFSLNGGELRIDHTGLVCDVGTAAVSGAVHIDESVDRWLSRPGVSVSADLDVARLSTVFPRLLRIREGTELTEGKIAIRLASKTGTSGTEWEGSVVTTALRGSRDRKPLAWEHPLNARFEGRLRADGLPMLSRFEAQSDFIGLAARGSPDAFEAAANLNLDRLAARLAEFVDLGGTRFGGTAAVTMRTAPRSGGGTVADGSVKMANFTYTDGAGRNLQEREVAGEFHAFGVISHDGPIRVDEAEGSLAASGDRLALKLTSPISNLGSPTTCRGQVNLSGELARWRNRLGEWVGIPSSWELGGSGEIVAAVDISSPVIRVELRAPNLKAVRFRGSGVTLDERWLKLESDLNWQRETGAIELKNVVVHCDTIVVTTPRFELATPPGGGTSAKGKATVTANVNRIQRALGLQSDAADGDAINGLAKGTLALSAGPATGFEVDVIIEDLLYGQPINPLWKERSVRLMAVGDYDGKSDGVHLKTLHAARDGLDLVATGTLAALGTNRDLKLSGKLTYDLAKLEPKLKEVLGSEIRAVGQDSRPFTLTGRLGESASMTLASKSGSRDRSVVESMQGKAAIGWQHVRAYGFDVGPGELRTVLERGVVQANPVDATFADGKVRLHPRLDLQTKDYDMTFARGRVVENARLTPAVCAGALGYVLPGIANAAQADGLVSFELEDGTVPLNNVNRSTVRGRLTLHKATISPGPILTEVASLLGAQKTTHTLASNQVVPVRVEGGRVHHENFTMAVGKGTVRTSGSVGFDGSLALVLELPVPQRLIEQTFPRQTAVREALMKQFIRVPVGGTLARPQLDPRAFEAATNQVLRAAAQAATDELIRKGEDKLLEELRKRLGQPPPTPKK